MQNRLWCTCISPPHEARAKVIGHHICQCPPELWTCTCELMFNPESLKSDIEKDLLCLEVCHNPMQTILKFSIIMVGVKRMSPAVRELNLHTTMICAKPF